MIDQMNAANSTPQTTVTKPVTATAAHTHETTTATPVVTTPQTTSTTNTDEEVVRSQAWQLGSTHGTSQAAGGIARVQGDALTQGAIEKASAATGVSVDDLTAMSIIESSGNRNVGTNAFGYTGLMQMGQDAATDVGMDFDSMKGGANVDNNAMAGAKYWNINDQRLDEDIPRDPLHMYLAHQQGAGGTNTLMNNLENNPTGAASRNQANNLPPEVVEALGGTATQQDFYDYWGGKMGAIQTAIQESHEPATP